ncbi:hypothetical protein BaRGS_00017877 [Batillaria attramentaria]|uniref:Uncharacterized protein n=1 Tax=Batillaria attramentaria TaxID=370345 RepID=A0ABD0KUZ7_9CAEN
MLAAKDTALSSPAAILAVEQLEPQTALLELQSIAAVGWTSPHYHIHDVCVSQLLSIKEVGPVLPVFGRRLSFVFWQRCRTAHVTSLWC